ncbi:MAG: hypothetical protein RJB65_856 [Actinomycetota bacterium]|jgi:isopenicillin N synthase-like dioxygenase
MSSIPAFSLRRWRDATVDERPAVAAEFMEMCHGIGFFHLVDHGVADGLVDEYFRLLEAFFTLPVEVKQTIEKSRSRHFRGWERLGSELTNNRVDHREQIDLATENVPWPDDALPLYLRLDGPNQWLDDDVLPGFRTTITTFLDLMDSLAWELMDVMTLGLGLEAGTFRRLFGERPFSLAKLIHYPATPEGEAGVNPHNDAGFLTLLMPHGVGGLEALAPDGTWISADPPPGAFVCNMGEMLQAITGNYVVAATHRVIAHERRFSTAYFHGPDLRTSLEPLPLDPRFAAAVDASPRHRSAGFMAKRDELLAGRDDIASTSAPCFGQQLWNYYVRSYPDNVAQYYADDMA